MAKWIIGIIVVLIAAGALWWSGWLNSVMPSQTATSTPQTATTDTQQTPPPTNGMSDASDNSDTALIQDTAAVDAQLQGLSSDSGDVDSSLNDKSVQ